MGKSKAQKKAEKQTKKYYEEKKVQQQSAADLNTARLKEDLAKIYEYAGISQNRAIQDYTTNIGNIEANKALDVASLNDYVTVNRGRTQEDLTTSLAKESRRFALESDQINQSLADRGMTFSERTPETIAKTGSATNVSDINTAANRSFQDIFRYEAAKTAELQNKYGQQTEQATTAKTRTLEDIIKEQDKAVQANARGVEDTSIALKNNLSDLSYQKSDSLSSIGNAFDTQNAYLKKLAELKKVTG